MIKTKYSVVLLLWFGLGACAEQAPSPQAANTLKPTGSANSKPTFELSRAPAPELGVREGNWCYAGYGESLLVNAEKINTNRRYFYLTEGITKLVVGPSGNTATLLLQALKNGNVMVFTGANFPECLSAPANLSPAGGNASLRYNNHKNIDFHIDLQFENGQAMVTVEFPPSANYAMSVNHCPECK